MGIADSFAGKRMFLTGHTGFKGAWLTKILLNMGADVCGYSLQPPTDPSLFELLGLADKMDSHIGDVRDLEHLQQVFDEFKPQVVLHLAAQPIVRASYEEPRYTYEVNVMGTVNILECVRNAGNVESFLNVTTDKVYLNRERAEGYREDEQLDGFDPYSNSKSCSELVTHSYARSFFAEEGATPISTARAGNVIGGGDFARDRIIPDCVRSVCNGEPLIVRNPHSIRPYQHVLEPLFAYLMIAARQAEDPALAGWYNVGPDEEDCVTTEHLANTWQECWNASLAEGEKPFTWENRFVGGPHEANFLKLDCGLLKRTFGWHPVWNIDEAIAATADWTRVYVGGGDLSGFMDQQIDDYLNEAANFC